MFIYSVYLSNDFLFFSSLFFFERATHSIINAMAPPEQSTVLYYLYQLFNILYVSKLFCLEYIFTYLHTHSMALASTNICYFINKTIDVNLIDFQYQIGIFQTQLGITLYVLLVAYSNLRLLSFAAERCTSSQVNDSVDDKHGQKSKGMLFSNCHKFCIILFDYYMDHYFKKKCFQFN